MLIGILSDTHNRLDRTIAAVAILQNAGAEALIHCGDLTGPDIVHACGILPATFVLGNNDFDVPILKRAVADVGGTFLGEGGVVTLAGKRLAVTHGHMTKDVRSLLAANPDYLFYGHSHLADDSRSGSIRQINPGALHRADEYTVALLDLARDELRFLRVPR